MDKRWCEWCGKESYANPYATVQWYNLEGSEVTLCKPCAKKVQTEGLDIQAFS